jgi:hypothetical protein
MFLKGLHVEHISDAFGATAGENLLSIISLRKKKQL